MAEKINFRSAFNGFRREDVVHYIEMMTSKHNTALNQLKSENSQLQARLEEAVSKPAQDPLTLEMLARAERERDEYRARCQELEAQIAASASREEQHQAELAAARAEAEAAKSQTDRELEAYRRAERAEREAKARAEQICHQANGTLADASVQVDEAAVRVEDAAGQILAQLDAFRAAVTESRDALRGAVDTLGTIRPEGEE